MKRVFGVILVAGLVFGTLAADSGAKQLTLDDCIEQALATRAAIIRARGAEATAAAGKRSALGAFLPRISGSYSYSKGKEYDIEPPNVRTTATETVLDTTTIGGQTAVDAVSVPTAWEIVDEQDVGPRKSWYGGASMTLAVSSFFDYFAAKADHARARLDVLPSESWLFTST